MVETLHQQTTAIKIESKAILANSNTVFNAISYSTETKLLAYACANQVLIATTDDRPKVLFSLNGHSVRVNSVAWFDQNTIISVSD